jgi:hypothetical protein
MPAPQEIFGDFISWKSLRELHKKNELLAAALVPSGTLSRTLSNGILPVLVLLAGKMPALQEILGYFLN